MIRTVRRRSSYSLSTIHYSLSTIHYSLSTASYCLASTTGAWSAAIISSKNSFTEA